MSQQLLKSLAAVADETDAIELQLPSRPSPAKLRALLAELSHEVVPHPTLTLTPT